MSNEQEPVQSAPRLKVLMSAYACEPGKGSEPEVGWAWAMQMARFHDVTVLTRTNNRQSIEEGLRALPPGHPKPRFIYFDGGPFALWLKKTFNAVRPYYIYWQRSAYPVIADLVRREKFDLLHHVTFAGYRFDTAIWGHGVPTIWGPVGGMESIPMRMLPWGHPFTLMVESLRNAHNTLQLMPFHVLPARAAHTSRLLVSTKETQRAFETLQIDATLFPTIGIDAGAISQRKLSAPQGMLEILFVGRLIALKGIELALHALKQAGGSVRFTIVGDGPFLKEAKRLTRQLEIEERVVFRGRVSRDEVLAMLPQYHVFLFPSLHDSGAFAVLEAMANGLPVICLDCGGPAISVGDGCGIRVPLHSRGEVIAGITEAIRFYDSNREAVREHGEAARKFVAENYEWSRKGENMADIYQSTVDEARVPVVAARSLTGNVLWKPVKEIATSASSPHRYAFSAKGVVVTLVLFLLFGAAQVSVLQVLKKRIASIVEDTLPGLSYAGEASAKLSQAAYRLRMCTYATDPEELRRYRAEMEDIIRQTTEDWNRYERAIYEPEDRMLFVMVNEKRNHYIEIRAHILGMIDEKKQPEAVQYYQSTVIPVFQEYKAAADALFDYNVKQGQNRGQSAIVLCRVTQILMVLLGIALFVTGFLLGFFK